jgi:hypothetical protein
MPAKDSQTCWFPTSGQIVWVSPERFIDCALGVEDGVFS